MTGINTDKGKRPNPSELPPRDLQLAVLKQEGYKGPPPRTRKEARELYEELLRVAQKKEIKRRERHE